jgi:thiol-disulfide isomerase/thioredoxin
MLRLGEGEFDGPRLRRDGVWGVAFLADWCPFCRTFAPRFQSLEGAGPYSLAVADLTDEEGPLWDRFEIGVVPTVAVFRDGVLAFRRDGQLGRGLSERDLGDLREELARGPGTPSGATVHRKR